MFYKQMIPFEFIIQGPPVSQQTRNRSLLRDWKNRVRFEAQRKWPSGNPPTQKEIEIRITYFYEDVSPDVNNITKPIQDALKGLIFEDDRQIVNLTCRKRSIDGSFRIRGMSRELANGFIIGRDFIHVMIAVPTDMQELI